MPEDTLFSAETRTQSGEFQEIDFEGQSEPIVLTVEEAAIVLGKSIRAINRSLSGKWGNRLPEGWSARKAVVDGLDEWQILPGDAITKEQIQEAIERVKKADEQRGFDDFLGSWSVEPPKTTVGALAPALPKQESELEHLLREVATAHKALAEERSKHIEDLRTLYELQTSMRLIESNSNETAKLKAELLEAQKDMLVIKNQYKEFMALPWWKRLFRRAP